jgi:hypothetical protein
MPRIAISESLRVTDHIEKIDANRNTEAKEHPHANPSYQRPNHPATQSNTTKQPMVRRTIPTSIKAIHLTLWSHAPGEDTVPASMGRKRRKAGS